MRPSGWMRVLGALVLTSWVAVFAGCNAVGSDLDCPAGQTDCGGFCANLMRSQEHCGACGAACPQNAACSNGTCRLWCPAGTTACGEGCAELVIDELNCGACGVACAEGECCHDSVCTTDCAAGEAVGGGGRGSGRYDDSRVDHGVPTPSGNPVPHP